MELTKEDFETILDRKLSDQTKELKAFAAEQAEELARMVAAGFEDVQKRLDVKEQVERHEKLLFQVTQKLGIGM